jgi:hypothetical protein
VRPPAGDEPPALRAFDAARGVLSLDPALPAESRAFQLAHQLARIELAGPIAEVSAAAGLRSPEAARLLSVGLANYAAGAILMPYEAFRQEARRVRHDIDRLRRPFVASFEQACHRLSTLQRPDARGTPFFFCRVDMAGNITKRHSATRLQFARFGGACPLWIMHEAVAIPDRILTQLGRMPDGVRYVSIAKGLVKESGSYARAPRRQRQRAGRDIAADRLRSGIERIDIVAGIVEPVPHLVPRQAAAHRRAGIIGIVEPLELILGAAPSGMERDEAPREIGLLLHGAGQRVGRRGRLGEQRFGRGFRQCGEQPRALTLVDRRPIGGVGGGERERDGGGQRSPVRLDLREVADRYAQPMRHLAL